MKKGLLTAGDKQYYLDEKDGVKKLGFVKVADKTYYFVEDGEKKSGFVKIDDKTYYVKEGVRLTGDITVNPKQGIVVIDGKKFFIDSGGNRQVGW